MNAPPHALIIEDNQDDAEFAALLLSDAGFTTSHAPALLRGLDHAQQLLDVAQPAHPTLLLLDLMLPTSRCRVLEGRTAAAYLIERMERGQLHPAPIVAITAEPDPQRVTLAHVAGCRAVLAKPLTARDATMLRHLVATPPAQPYGEDAGTERQLARQAMQHDAHALVSLLRGDAVETQMRQQRSAVLPLHWTTEQVEQLLRAPMTLLAIEPWQTWARAFGGQAGLFALLQQLTPPHLHDVLAALWAYGDDWRGCAAALCVSHSTYYRRRTNVIQTLATNLTRWQPPTLGHSGGWCAANEHTTAQAGSAASAAAPHVRQAETP